MIFNWELGLIGMLYFAGIFALMFLVKPSPNGENRMQKYLVNLALDNLKVGDVVLLSDADASEIERKQPHTLSTYIGDERAINEPSQDRMERGAENRANIGAITRDGGHGFKATKHDKPTR